MLCNVEDVVFEGDIKLTSELEKKIEYKIQNISTHIAQLTYKDPSNEKYIFHAKMACIYGVLTWLESRKLISPSSVVNVREGNISITYQSDDDEGQYPSSYKELYNYYMAFLLPYPPTGNLI